MRLEKSFRDGLYFSMRHLQCAAYRPKDAAYKGFFFRLNKALNFVPPGLN